MQSCSVSPVGWLLKGLFQTLMKGWFSLSLDPQAWLTIGIVINRVNVLLHVLVRRFGCGDHIWVSSSIWQKRVTARPIKQQSLPSWAEAFWLLDYPNSFNWRDSAGIGCFLLLKIYWRGITVFFHTAVQSPDRFVLKDLLKDVNSFLIFKVLIFSLNSI